MNRRTLVIVGGFVALVVIGAAVWYLASPLFINRAVDEAFPFEMPSETEMAGMTAAEKEAMAAEFEAAVPTEEEVAELSAEDRQEVEAEVMAAAAAMPDKEMAEPMPADQPTALAQGQFVNADSFHQGSGAATIYQLPDGSQVLRLEAFMVTNGPDLHVILTRHPAPASRAEVGEDYVDLGSLKGNQGDQNYDIPAGVDVSQYQSVVIYCVPFHVVFATATLTQG